MELRGQENDTRTSVPSSYSHQSSGVERRNHNGNTTTVLTYTQTLDHHRQARSPNPDRFPIISKGSNSKTTHVRYRECLRNHAASVGGNVFDGCGEFMPGGEEGSLEALKCAACECHRNFHRKEVDGETQFSPSSRRSPMVHSLQLPPPLPSPTVLHHQQRYSVGLHSTSPTTPNMVQPMTVAFGGGGTESSSEDLNAFHSNADGVPPPPPYVLSKKRFRTKFTHDQKDKMMEFAEKVGWRINKQDEEEVDKFCAEIGVRRQVFKVWMHNNKNLKKQQQQQEQEQEQEPL
ncbi:zinc-finger homeodomain protein 5 [Ricinus communis]|uniref:Transcription factor, putative n=1 Tax=Ricinus communis TaxID=3988 RepID=B9R7V6_RICCO|nr:zinc-finger homeodomain protein 5 [Ricinus communis]EEF52586.1 transcription factor, putative [Ricinus communis]|eukprot:XP_002510399.1 zinc-finger homeodomain protein 5 [Ricinus communis]